MCKKIFTSATSVSVRTALFTQYFLNLLGLQKAEPTQPTCENTVQIWSVRGQLNGRICPVSYCVEECRKGPVCHPSPATHYFGYQGYLPAFRLSALQCTLDTVQCTQYNLHCTMYNVHCTMHSVQHTCPLSTMQPLSGCCLEWVAVQPDRLICEEPHS